MDASPRRGTGARILFVVPAAALLLTGLYAGLVLLGVPVPLILSERLADLHSTLLVFGFVGTLISLERAVALRARWAYLAPGLLAVGSILTLTPMPVAVGKAVVTVGLVVHLLQYRAIWRRQPMTATAVQAVGVAVAVAAAVAWAGGVGAPSLVPLLAAFLVLTIAGERLELARMLAPGVAAERVVFGLSLALGFGSVVSLVMPVVAVPLCGTILLALVAWLLRHDIARLTIRQSGLPRFVAVCVYAGYTWLALAGLAWLLGGARTEGPVYDAATHAIFLGFVITMIMAHAPLILPAVLRVSIPYHPALYVPVALLQLSLLVRVVAGDAWQSTIALQAGGIGAIVAIVLFAATAVTVSVLHGRQTRRLPDRQTRARREESPR